VLHYCRLYGRSVYDSSYLALAEQEGVDLITADERLLNSVQKDLPWVRWIG
jgi:predicted nucleic acid-binding protein